jgi:hypothetical protein
MAVFNRTGDDFLGDVVDLISVTLLLLLFFFILVGLI